jgi:hypothetical protein
MCSLLLLLNHDVLVFILSEWLSSYREVSALDMAVLNSVLRAKYLSSMKQLMYGHNQKLICSMKLLNNIKFKNFCLSRYTNPISACEIDFVNGGSFSFGFQPVARMISSFETLRNNYSIKSVERVAFNKLIDETEDILQHLGKEFPNLKHLSINCGSLYATKPLLPADEVISPISSLKLSSFTMKLCDENTLRFLQLLETSPSKQSLRAISLTCGSRIRAESASYILMHIVNRFPHLRSVALQGGDEVELQTDTLNPWIPQPPPPQGYPGLQHLTITFSSFVPLYYEVILAVYEKKNKQLIPLFQAAQAVEELYLLNLTLIDLARIPTLLPAHVPNRVPNERNVTSDLSFTSMFEALIPSAWKNVRILHLQNITYIEARIFPIIFRTCGHRLESFLLVAHQCFDDTTKDVVLDVSGCESLSKECTVLHTLHFERVQVVDVKKLCEGKFPLQYCIFLNCLGIADDEYATIGERFALKTFRVEYCRKSDDDVRVNFQAVADGLISKSDDKSMKKAMHESLESLEVGLYPNKSIVVVIRGESTGSKNRPKQSKAAWKSLSVEEFPYFRLRSLVLSHVYLDTMTLQTILTNCSKLSNVVIGSAKRYEIDLNVITPQQLQFMQSFRVCGEEVLLSIHTLTGWIAECKLLTAIQCASKHELPSWQDCERLKMQYYCRIREIIMSTAWVNPALNSDEEEDPAGYELDMFD